VDAAKLEPEPNNEHESGQSICRRGQSHAPVVGVKQFTATIIKLTVVLVA
jgi:hypothetical protein